MNLYGIELDDKLYKHFLEFLTDSEIDAIFRAITIPPPRYYLRVNTAAISRDDLIKRLNSRGVPAFRDEHIEEAIWMPVVGPHKIPSARKIVVVDKKAAESVMMGADLYAPGVIKTDVVHRGEEVNIVADNGKVVAYGIAEIDSEKAMRERRGIYIKVIKSLYKTPKIRELPEYREGLLYSQSLPAIAVGYIARRLGVKTAVDLNAAPGGKATHLAQCGIAVLAIDRSRVKIERLRLEASRLRVNVAIDPLIHDSRYLDRDFPRLKAELALVDPPCSDIGVRPKIYHKLNYDSILTLSKYQIQFLKTSLKISKYVIYSTCTLTFLENEYVVKKANGKIIELDLPIGSPGWGCRECRRFLPHIHQTPGFFIALLAGN